MKIMAYTYTAAKARGISIKVETQGSIGIENKITEDDVKNADVVILTKDMGIKETERFNGLPTVKVAISDVVKKSDQIIEKVQVYINSKK